MTPSARLPDATLSMLFDQYKVALEIFQERRTSYVRWQIALAQFQAFGEAMQQTRTVH